MLQQNSWKIRQGVKYFMLDVTFGANSVSISICMFNLMHTFSVIRDILFVTTIILKLKTSIE